MNGTFIHSSMFGTYNISCKVLTNINLTEDTCLIEYIDPWSNETIKKEVSKELVNFYKDPTGRR